MSKKDWWAFGVACFLLVAMAITLEFTQKPTPLPTKHKAQIVWTCQDHPTVADC